MVVLDGVGVGAAEDAAEFGDLGADTLGGALAGAPPDRLPNLAALGLAAVHPSLTGPSPAAQTAILHPEGPAKDSLTGHWELMGWVRPEPPRTWPRGFPAEVLDPLSDLLGEPLGNRPVSGTVLLAELGLEHLRTGRLLVYTSGDSVFQVAAHEEVLPPSALNDLCALVAKRLMGEGVVDRVISRPFAGSAGAFTRLSAARRDWTLLEAGPTVLDEAAADGLPVKSIGKVADLFGGFPFTDSRRTKGNADGIAAVREELAEGREGLVIANLVDFDSEYGHRRDPEGFRGALAELDDAIPSWLAAARPGDLVVLTADHGNDPAFREHTDHTRERVPCLLYNPAGAPDPGVVEGPFRALARTIREVLALSNRPGGGPGGGAGAGRAPLLVPRRWLGAGG